jgi:heme/copper-type cytochrome/quinol oxidase subunit 4
MPYYLVVNRTITGTALLATILGFAVLQMLVQVVFFLHLGRGPKPNWNLFFFVSTVGIILVVVGGSMLIIHNLHYNMTPVEQVKKIANDEGIYQIGGQATGACQGQHTNHEITIQNGQVNPGHTLADKCDTLTFISEDNEPRKINFGTSPQQKSYAGETELLIQKGRNQTITLSDSGAYQFYDHFHAETAGDFYVTP